MLSFYFLKLFKIYRNPDKEFVKYALIKTLEVGGDTDTNACVVMGMVGALVGYKSLPVELLGKVLSFDCTKDIIKRDKFLSVKYNAVPLINHIINNRPQKGDNLKILNDYTVVKPKK